MPRDIMWQVAPDLTAHIAVTALSASTHRTGVEYGHDDSAYIDSGQFRGLAAIFNRLQPPNVDLTSLRRTKAAVQKAPNKQLPDNLTRQDLRAMHGMLIHRQGLQLNVALN